MGYYSVGGRSVATAATDEIPAANFWNPATNKRLWVVEISVSKTVATIDNPAIQRTSTIGTAGSTVTPDIDNAYERDFAPPSGCVLDLDWSAIPTVALPHLKRMHMANNEGMAEDMVFRWPGICVPPGTGLQTVSTTGGIAAADHTFVWYEPT